MAVSTPEDLANSAATAPALDVSYAGAQPDAPQGPQAPGVSYGVTPKQIETARSAGYSDDAIIQHLATVTTVPIAAAQKQGYSATDILDYLATPPPPPAPTPEDPGITATAGHELERQALPAVGGFAGFEAAAPIGAKLGALAGAAIPGLGETGIPEAVGGTIGGFAAGTLGAFGGGEVVQKAQQFVMDLIPDNIKEAIGQSDSQQQAERLAHPYIQTAVDLASNLAFVRPGSVANDLREGATAFEKIMASPVGSRVAGAGFMTGMEAGQEEIHDGELDPKKLLIASVVGALSNKKTALGEGIEKGVQGLGAKFAPSVYHSAGSEAAPGEPADISNEEFENKINKVVDDVADPNVSLDSAIDTTQAAAKGNVVTPAAQRSGPKSLEEVGFGGETTPLSQTDKIAAKVDDIGAAAPEQPVEPFPGLNAGSIKKVDDETYNYSSKGPDGQDVSVPLKVWNPETAPQSDTAISPELADAQRDHYGKLGVDVVYFENDHRIPFDGAVDPTQPNTLFLSNDPQRNAEQVGAHEVTHVLESTKLPDGTSLGDLLHQQVAAGITETGRAYAEERFGVSAPKREDFGTGQEGDAAHAQAITVHLVKELAADLGGEAPKFDSFFPKVVSEVESRYGKSVASDVLQKFMDGIKAAMDTIKKFFGSDSEGTISQHLVNNLGEVHDTLAKMYAAKYGETAGFKDVTPADDAANKAAFVKNETPPPVSETANADHPLGPTYVDARTMATTYARWLGELDAKRRADAQTSEPVKLLQQTQSAILNKVGGAESKLTDKAAARLADVRSQLDAHLNPVGDSPVMAHVREAMLNEQQRMADAASVSKLPNNGAQFSPRQTETPEFKKWFGDSKVVDESNEPKVLYHGTKDDVSSFDLNHPNRKDAGWLGRGVYLFDRPDAAGMYAGQKTSASGEKTSDAAGQNIMPLYASLKNPYRATLADKQKLMLIEHAQGNKAARVASAEWTKKLQAEGYDGVVFEGAGVGWKNAPTEYVVFDPSSVKSAVGNNGKFDARNPDIRFSPRKAANEGISQPGVGTEDENMHGFAPALRVKVYNPPKFEISSTGKPVTLLGQDTTNKNAVKQLENLDTILSKFRNPTASPEEWSRMMSYALGSDEVPIPPYAFIKELNDGTTAKKIASLSAGQISDANHGFEQAAAFRKAYVAGQIEPEITGKLFLWSFLSRGVSPYAQEGLFVDAFHGSEDWIRRAVEGKFTEADIPAYTKWAKSVAPKGSGQPGAGATHNLNAFGVSFLYKMGQVGEDGKTNLQRMHDMFSDPNMTGQQIRREFMKFGQGVGIGNKVVSFTLLVAGHPDVMVIDRVQTRQLWDDGRFADRNLYDGVNYTRVKLPDGTKHFIEIGEGETDADFGARVKAFVKEQAKDLGVPLKEIETKRVKITATSLADLSNGVRGLLAYETIERGLQAKIGEIYEAAGRPQDASVGRYHWESWVAYSQQEASHGTLEAILNQGIRPGNRSAIADVTAKQGEYGAYEYGAHYGRGDDGQPYFLYNAPGGKEYEFSVPAFRAFLTDIKKPATGVVPTKFKVTNSGNGPWYDRPEVNRQQLDAVADKYADRNGRAGALLRTGESADVSGGPERGLGAGGKNVGGVKYSPKRDEQAFLAVRGARANRTGDESASYSYARRSRGDGEGPRVLSSLGVSYDAEWTPGPSLRKTLTEGGIEVPLRVLELHPDDANAAVYEKAISKAKAGNEFGASVAVYPVEDYKNFKLLLSDDGKSGAAVKPDGDIVSVFGGDKSGHAILEAAIAAGGRKLDAFDTILPTYYHMHGFVEAARVPWDDAQSPEGWSKDTFAKYNKGQPDVVLMALDRNDTSPILETGPTFTSWDEAVAAQEKMVKRFDRESPGAVINLRLDRKDGGQPTKLVDAKAEIEKTGAQVIAERTRKISGAEGEPGVVMHLSRPLTKEEGLKISDKLKQDAISQYANGRGDVFGPRAEKWGAFDASKFHTLEEGQSLHSPRLTPEQIERLTKLNPAFANMFRKNKTEVPATEQKAPVEAPKAEQPKTEQPKAEEAKAESEAPKAEEPKAERVGPSLAHKPVEGKGELKKSRVNGADYHVVRDEDQLRMAEKLLKRNPDAAIAIAMHTENTPTGSNLLPTAVFVTVRNFALARGDGSLVEKLNKSPMAREITMMGQSISFLRNLDPLDPGNKIQQINDAWANKNKGTHETVEQAVQTETAKAAPKMEAAIKTQVVKRVKAAPKQYMAELSEYIQQIKCR